MKILYVTTISNTVNAFLIPHIRMLVEKGHQVDVAFNIVQEVDSELNKLGCTIHSLGFNRSPLKKKNYQAYEGLKKLIRDEQYDLVHTHTPIASAFVRLACRKFKNIKVIYTAHGFHFFRGAPLKNWLVYYPVERILARYTDVLITINKEDYERATKYFKPGRVEYMPGVGIDTRSFSAVTVDKITKRSELGVPDDALVILSVGELNKNKNHETVIRALAKLNKPEVHYIICGQGPLENYLKSLIKEVGLEGKVHLLGYRRDVAEICKSSDIFTFPSLREGLGLAALEAMASGLPLITSNVHGIVDYSVDSETGYTCSPMDVNGFARAIEKLAQESASRIKIGKHNIEIVKRYNINNVLRKMRLIYRAVDENIYIDI